MVGSRMVGSLVFDKNALAIILEIALVTGGLVRVMCVYYMKLKVAKDISHDATLWTDGSG